MYAVGLCQHCYAQAQRHSRRTANTHDGGFPAEGKPLSPREVQILRAVARGLTNAEIAGEIAISEQTVKNHMTSLLHKLRANDRAHAVAIAAQRGLLNPGVEGAPVDPYVAYFEAIEVNVRRLRRDLNGMLAMVREARRLRTEPLPKARIEYVQKGETTLVRNRFRNRGDFCKRGHLFDVANTRINARGCRHCRACAREKARTRGAAERAALRREEGRAA